MAVIEAIATTYLEADVSSVTFDDIPSTYEHLQIRASGRDATSGDIESVYMRLGDSGHSPVDTGSNYTRHYMWVYTTSEYASATVAVNSMYLGKLAAATSTSAFYGCLIVDILDYANANKNTTVSGLNFSGQGVSLKDCSGLWQDASVVNAVTIMGGGNFVRGSEFSLYGLKSS